MDSKLITIVIPTYNRCAMLDESLQIAIPQVRRFKDDVHLYVSDNASTDDTQNVMKKYIQDNTDIMTYFRQNENIGAQNNFRHAVNTVDSKYVCLIGDDDVLFPNYVETIVNVLRDHPDVGFVNYNVLSVHYDLKKAYLREKDVLSLYPIEYDSGKDFILEHLEVPSLVSSNVFNRRAFVENMDTDPVGTYPGYDWFAVLYKSFLTSKCIYIGLPLLLQRIPSEQRWGKDFAWFMIYGLGKLFRDLDANNPGLEERWTNSFYIQKRNFFKYVLRIMADNKDLYRERYHMMLPYITHAKLGGLYVI